MPTRKASGEGVMPPTKADSERRRHIKTESARLRESLRTLRALLHLVGGSCSLQEGHDFKLVLTGLRLERLPVEFFEDDFLYHHCVAHLVGIDASGNQLKELDEEIGDFENLISLNFSKNK